MKLAANAAIFFKELPIEQRIEQIAELGFEAADLFGLKGFDIPSLAKTCRACGVTNNPSVRSNPGDRPNTSAQY